MQKRPLNTLKLYSAKYFFSLLLTSMKNDFFNIISRFNKKLYSIKVMFYSKAFQYMCYKKVFLDENPKTRLTDIKKL